MWGFVVWVLPSLRRYVRGVSGRLLERVAVVGESPVRENTACVVDVIPGGGCVFGVVGRFLSGPPIWPGVINRGVR